MSGAENYGNEVEFFSRDRGFVSGKNRLRKCELASRNFSADGEPLKSSSEDWNSQGHLPGVEGKKDEVHKVPDSVYPSQNSSRCEERLEDFYVDLKKCSEETQISTATEHLQDGFDATGCLQDPVKVEETRDTKERKESEYDDIRHLRRREESSRKFGKIGEKLKSVFEKKREWLEKTGEGLENHFEVDQRQNVAGKRFESAAYGIAQSGRSREGYRMFDAIKEKLISISEDAQRRPGRWLGVAEGQDAVRKESLQPAFMILESERAAKFTDMGRSASVSNDATGLVEHRLLQAERKKDAVGCSSTSVESHGWRRPKFNHVSFFLVNQMQETEVKVIGFSPQALNLAKKNGSRSLKERLGGSVNKEKKDASESKFRPILKAQEGLRSGYSHGKQEVFYNTQQKPSILGIRPQFCSEEGSGRRMNEIGPKVYGRRDETFSCRHPKEEMQKNKVKYGGRKPLEEDGKQNGLSFVARMQSRRAKRGERPKRRYPRSKLLELRYMNIDQQKRRWNEIYQGLSPAVAKEYNQIAACYDQKQRHKDADWPPYHRKNKDGGGFRNSVSSVRLGKSDIILVKLFQDLLTSTLSSDSDQLLISAVTGGAGPSEGTARKLARDKWLKTLPTN
ncbi:hypothetical protein ACLOJK_009056 [Asimina triloba]